MTELDTARAAFKAWQADPIDLGWKIPVGLVHALEDEVERVERKATTFAKIGNGYRRQIEAAIAVIEDENHDPEAAPMPWLVREVLSRLRGVSPSNEVTG